MISLLIGSGFSEPDKVPLVWNLNNFLLNLKYEDIYLHSSHALLLNAKPSVRYEEHHEKFIVDFIQFYNKNYNFDYEDLFDYAYSYISEKENNEEIESFFNDFLKHHNFANTSVANPCEVFVRRFIENYSQLISTKLSVKKYFRDVSYGNYPPYDSFFNFLDKISNEEDIHIHSLNHDLLFDHLASKLCSISQKFTDGYEEMGSPFYGEVYANFPDGEVFPEFPVKYHARLKRFTNTFNLVRVQFPDACVVYNRQYTT